MLNTRAIYKVARLELFSAMIHPIIPVACLIVLAVAILNGAGEAVTLKKLELNGGFGDVLLAGFCQSFGTISMICTVIAAFLGATMVPSERWKNSLNVILAKPLYRKDYLLGKFIGMSVFMLIFNTFTLLLVSLMMIVFFRSPQSDLDFISRLVSYVFVLTLVCSLVIALNLLFGVIAKSVLFVTTASIVYLFFDWIWYNDRIIGTGLIALLTPINLYSKLLNPFDSTIPILLFDTTVSLGKWLEAIVPFLILLVIEVILLLLIEIFIFSREDST